MDRFHRRLLFVVAGVVTLTLAGMVLLWPRGALPGNEAPPEPLIDGIVRSVTSLDCPPDEFSGARGPCLTVEVEVLAGPDAGTISTIEVREDEYPRFAAGDRVKLVRSETDGEVEYFVQDFLRLRPLLLLAILFVATVLLVGRWHGVRSLVGLALSLGVVVKFIVPALLAGRSPAAVAVVGALAIMVSTLYLTHGLNEMTTAAVVGTAAALVLTVLLGIVFVELTKLTGLASDEANLARFAVAGLDLKGLVLAGLIIGALGVLDDVTVSQSSTVFAVHAADPEQSWGVLFRRAMSVGRDHIASTVNTLFLAYAGASLALLVLFSTGGLAVGEVLNLEVLATELVRTMAGSIGLISAVPLTTALAASMAKRLERPVPALPAYAEHAEEEGDDDDRAYRSWMRYLREGRREGE